MLDVADKRRFLEVVRPRVKESRDEVVFMLAGLELSWRGASSNRSGRKFPGFGIQAGVEAAGAGGGLARVFDGMFGDFAEQILLACGRRGVAGTSVLSRIDRV